jgi:threonine dehydrogenase-like Zn-dependent dehydrogenase
LGHEIIGTIIEMGDQVRRDMRGESLEVGDRITWSEYFIPSRDYFSEVLDLPQKSAGVEKYGHKSAVDDPHFHGGFAEYCYILPHSWVLKLPPELSDEEATPINCGVATMIAVVEAAAVTVGQTVVIQGLGLLGLYGAAICKCRGARLVIGIDPVAERRALASRFGVDLALDPDALGESGLIERIRFACQPNGADVVIEQCGVAGVIPIGLQFLRTGGSYILGGIVNPNAWIRIDANQLLCKLITLRGVHNYHPRHLVQACDFLVSQRHRYPFGDLVDGKYRLDQVNQAMADAARRRVLRAAIVP